MNWVEPLVGACLLLLTLVDVFLTVLYARAGTGIISYRLARLTWIVFGAVARPFGPRRRGRVLSFCGPAILVLLLLVWAFLLTLGAALILHPALSSGAVHADQGETPTDFVTAMYVGGSSMSIVGSSGFSPKNDLYRFLYLFFSLIGMSVTSLTLTYLMQVYNALQSRNALAMSIDLLSGETGDAAELLARCAPEGQFSAGYTNLANVAAAMTQVKEAHHFYPVLFYFRFVNPAYAASRFCLVALDTVTLIKSCLDDDGGRWLKESASVAQLWSASMRVLTTLEESFRGSDCDACAARGPDPDALTQERWRRRYLDGLRRLRDAGITTTQDERAGAKAYIALRACWNAQVMRLAPALGYLAGEIDRAVSPAHVVEQAGS